MTPKELMENALKASKAQYELVIAEFKKATDKGAFECLFENLTHGTLALLRADGFRVDMQREGNRETGRHKISIV
jgi:predicted glycosyl hydrolase (DUF1957 family)